MKINKGLRENIVGEAVPRDSKETGQTELYPGLVERVKRVRHGT